MSFPIRKYEPLPPLKRKDLSKESYESLLSKFRSENWNRYNQDDRLNLAQELENRNARQQGRTPCRVIANNEMDSYGVHYDNQKIIEVNLCSDYHNNNSYQVMDTILHEGQHDYQEHCVKKKVGLPEQTRAMCKVESFCGKYTTYDHDAGKMVRKNGYYNNENIPYDDRVCEMDANNAAFKEIAKNKDIFLDDREFQSYMETRKTHFEKINQRHQGERKDKQDRAIEESRDRKHLTEEQYTKLKQDIWQSKEKEPVIADSENCLKEINDMQQEIPLAQEKAYKAKWEEHDTQHAKQKEESAKEKTHDWKADGGIPPGYDDELKEMQGRDFSFDEEEQEQKVKR